MLGRVTFHLQRCQIPLHICIWCSQSHSKKKKSFEFSQNFPRRAKAAAKVKLHIMKEREEKWQGKVQTSTLCCETLQSDKAERFLLKNNSPLWNMWFLCPFAFWEESTFSFIPEEKLCCYEPCTRQPRWRSDIQPSRKIKTFLLPNMVYVFSHNERSQLQLSAMLPKDRTFYRSE